MKKSLKNMLCGVCSAAMLLGAVTFSASAAAAFTDVKPTDYFAKPVEWAVQNGITAGVSDTQFGPYQSCTRAQAMTFLWAAAGRPEPTASANFSDVKSTDYFAKAVAWAVENGITAGVGGGKFGASQPCTRGQIMTFLWRFGGSEEIQGGASFSDVSSSDYFAKPVAWAVKNEVTAGIGGGKFGPNQTCTRGQIMTMLWRADQIDAPVVPEPEKPTEPAPTEPEVTEPAPTEPKPTEPAPTEPEETKPTVHEHKWEYERTDNLEKWTCSDCGVVATLDPTDLPSVPLHDHKWVWGSLVRAYKCQDCGWQCSEPRAESEGLTLEEYYEREHGSTATPGTHTPKETKSFLMYHPNHDHWMCDKCGIVTSINPIK